MSFHKMFALFVGVVFFNKTKDILLIKKLHSRLGHLEKVHVAYIFQKTFT